MNVGDKIQTKRSGIIVVLSLGYDCLSASCRFKNTGYVKRGVSRRDLRIGNVKDPYAITFSGVGYMGIPRVHNKVIRRRAMVTWRGIISTCIKRGYSLSCEWKNFSNFLDWFNENYTDHCAYFIKNSKSTIYCKHTCRMTSSQDMHASVNEYKMKVNTLYDDKHNEYSFVNINKFCREKGLHVNNIWKVLKGKIKSYKGFSLTKPQ